MSSQLQVSGEAKIRDIQGPVVANSGVITALDGAASQYVRGDGTLADFPSSTGGGSSVSYYLNSSVSQGTIGGVAYRELSKEPIIGTGTDITIAANGYVANYITDANDPDVLSIPGGNFNCEFYFSVNNNTGAPYTYAELYKYDGTTFTLLGSSVGVPEYINQGTIIAPYYFAIPVPTSALALTDRLAIRIYVNVDGRTVTLHTENSHLCQVVTTLSKGMVSLNNLTDQSQFITTGTSGTDFNIVSSGDTHTFNLPVASATNTGKLSSTDWSTFNNKQAALSFTAPLVNTSNTISIPAATSLVDGYLDNLDWTNFNTAYNNMIVSAAVTGTTTKTLTLTQQDAGTITASWTDDNTDAVTSVFGRTGAVVAVSGDYNTSQVTENTNLYFTDARARAALSFTAGSGAYNSTTGVITIPTNNNQITNGSNFITLTSLSAGTGISYNNITGVITNSAPDQTVSLTAGAGISISGSYPSFTIASTITQYTDALARAAISLTTTGTSGAATYNSTTGVFNIPNYAPDLSGYVPTSRTITINGTSFDLSANRSYSVGTVTSVGLSSATSGVTIGSTPITTSGTITLAIATASGSQNGLLSSTDWTTFNNKQNALTNPVTGTGTTNYLPKFTGASTIGNSLVFDNGTSVGINQASPTRTLDILGASGIGTVLKLQGASGTTTYLQMAYNGATNAQSGYIGYNSSSQMQFFTNDTVALTIDSNRNLGLGVTPSAWAFFKAVQVSAGNSFVGYNNQAEIWSNSFFDGASKYYANGFATRYAAIDGRFEWYQAPSGTAGNAISFTQAMTLFANGGLGLATNTPTVSTGYQTFSISGSTGGQIEFQTAGVGKAFIYSNSTDLRFYTNGGAFRFENTTGLEVGYSAAIGLYKLDVNGTGRFSNDLSIIKSGAYATITTDATTGVNFVFKQGGVTKHEIFTNTTQFAIYNSTTASVALGIANATGAATFSSSVTAGGIITGSAGVNVGANALGTDRMLQVSGTAFTSGSGQFGMVVNPTMGTLTNLYGIYTGTNCTSATNSYAIYIEGSGGTVTNKYGIYQSGSGDKNYFAGNVGIGTSSPIGNLEVRGANRTVAQDGILQVNSNDSQAVNVGGSISFGGSYIGVGSITEWAQISGRKETSTSGQYSGYLQFATRPSGGVNTERMRITSDGKVNINNTSNTNYQLYVDGGSSPAFAAYSTSPNNQFKLAGTAPGLTINNTITSPTIGGALGACTSANDFITGTAAGDMILINQFTGNKLYITNYSGGVYLTQGATSWTANSDIRIKNINSNITNAVEKLSTLQTINFCYKDDISKKENLGLIAQEVEMVFPELIETNNDGILGVRYTELIPVLIEAIKEQQEQIKELKLELDKIKNK
jgi:hypothetical protein